MNKKSGKVQNKNGSSVEKKKAELMPLDDKKTSEKSSFTEFKDAPDKTESDILAGERPGNKVKDKEKTSGKEKPEAPVKRAAPGKKKSPLGRSVPEQLFPSFGSRIAHKGTGPDQMQCPLSGAKFT